MLLRGNRAGGIACAVAVALLAVAPAAIAADYPSSGDGYAVNHGDNTVSVISNP